MLLIHQSPHVRQSLLAQPITLDDFVAVVHVAIGAKTKQWNVDVAGYSDDETSLYLSSGGVTLTWDSERKRVHFASGFGNGVGLIRIERAGNDFTLVTESGSFPMQSTGDGTDGPITFDRIGGLNDSPGCRVLGVAILPGHPTAEDVARVEVGMIGYQLS